MGDTIVALSSGHPPAAVALIRTSGPSAYAAALALAGELPPPRHAVLRSLYHPATSVLLDQVLLLRFEGPASVTGEDVVEYQCHGGRAVVRSILDALVAQPGMRAAEPGEFTRRAFRNGRIDLTEAEGLADLLEAETESQRRAALLSADGGIRRVLKAGASGSLACPLAPRRRSTTSTMRRRLQPTPDRWRPKRVRWPMSWRNGSIVPALSC